MVLSAEQLAVIDSLVEQYRARCLWYLRRDFFPRDDVERRLVLSAIARHGDREAFLRAGEAIAWLSQPSSEQ